MNDPVVIDPQTFDQKAAWQECSEYAEKCGGMQHEDGEPNMRAAAGADPGVCSCPACKEMYWRWGCAHKCKSCGFIYPTDWWPMYSYGVQAARKATGIPIYNHAVRLQHPYYRYGFEHPADGQPHETAQTIDWRAAVGNYQ